MNRHNPFPGVTAITDRHLKRRYRLRRTIRGRKIDCYLPGPYGSPEFRAAYEEALEGTRIESRRASAGTIGFLIERYLASLAFRGLAPATQDGKMRRLAWITATIGGVAYAAMQPRHVEVMMARKGGPQAANRLRKDLRQLFSFAAKQYRFRGPNPAALADTYKVRSGGYHTWTDEEIEIYRATHRSGTKARMALELFLGTGAARQDAAALARSNIRGNRLRYRRGKTGQEVDLPILPELARELAQLPPGQMMLIAHGERAQPYKPETLANWFKDRCIEAELRHCSAHGLRKAGARRLAEAGATEFEIMSFLAHRTAQEASRYAAAANRMKLATSGMAKLAPRALSNRRHRLDKEE